MTRKGEMADVYTYKRGIKTIIKFKEDFDNIGYPKIPRKLIGELGELYVLSRLRELRAKKLIHKGGQGRYDIYLEDNGRKIEVRTSLLKNEGLYPEPIRFFGWRVKNRNQKKEDKFDIMIGVGLNEAFEKPQFYIFTYDEAFSVEDVEIGRFGNVQKKIHLFQNGKMFKESIKSRPRFVTRGERYINRHPLKFKDRWDKVFEI
jgi:hypothetical protein